MTLWTLILRGLRFHARSHFGTLMGAAIGSAILIGALAVGDSVRESLREMALSRLGKTEFALASNDRFFRARLADEINSAATKAAPVLQLSATAANDEGTARANQVQVLGVNDSFWNFADKNLQKPQTDDPSVALNSSLARQLKAKVGDIVLLRVHKPSLLSRDAPISPQQDFSSAFRLKVSAIVAEAELGNFSLRANQVPPFNAFVPIAFLQGKLGLEGKANLLLASSSEKEGALKKLEAALRQHWQLADAELQLRAITNQPILELRSARVFLDPPIVSAAVNAAAQANLAATYFVNELRVADQATPYSMVTAIGDPIVPKEMRDDEILINQWLADDLRAKSGDQMAIRYFTVGADQRLDERTNSFRIRGVVPLAGIYADRDLMPDFPGVSKAEKTEDWDAGFAIDMKKIRPKDEQYWKERRGTPKAFVTLTAGEKMWSNRFGAFTAVRFPAGKAPEIEGKLRGLLEPASVGLSFQPVREQALAASSQSQDFGQLFLGFSFFLIFAALLLVALLFQFGLEQRSTEIGTLLAMGFRPKQVRNLLLGEGMTLALAGGILGAAGGIVYARAMLLGLQTIWRSAVGTSSLQFHVTALTLAIGTVAGFAVSTLTIWLAVRNKAKRPAHELLAQGAELELENVPRKSAARNGSTWIGTASGIAALGLVAWAIREKNDAAAGIFFGAGALLLIAGLAFASSFLKHLGRSKTSERLTLLSLAIRGCSRRRKRSLATIGLLACGSFLVVSVAANRLDAEKDSRLRSSGTGGFALLGESTLPVTKDLNSTAGQSFFGLDEKDLKNVNVVPFRVREGDDASCLNLNRAQIPKLLGVNPQALIARKAFSFTKTLRDISPQNPWMLINQLMHQEVVAAGSINSPSIIDGSIPAIGDAASIQWALGKKVGDVIEYTDEHGNKFNVRIVGAVANSILQGSLIIDEAEFVKRFPSTSGYRMFLIDAPSENVEQVSATLSRALRDVGLELTPTEQRLAAFNAVQNTYLNTFQVLGGLGLLLGSAGLGIIVLRNVLERRGELAILLATGFRRRTLRWLVLAEHAALLWLGIGLGVTAAFVAVLPTLLSPRGELPYFSLAVTLGTVLASGMIWTWAATSLALRGELIESLRNN